MLVTEVSAQPHQLIELLTHYRGEEKAAKTQIKSNVSRYAIKRSRVRPAGYHRMKKFLYSLILAYLLTDCYLVKKLKRTCQKRSEY